MGRPVKAGGASGNPFIHRFRYTHSGGTGSNQNRTAQLQGGGELRENTLLLPLNYGQNVSVGIDEGSGSANGLSQLKYARNSLTEIKFNCSITGGVSNGTLIDIMMAEIPFQGKVYEHDITWVSPNDANNGLQPKLVNIPATQQGFDPPGTGSGTYKEGSLVFISFLGSRMQSTNWGNDMDNLNVQSAIKADGSFDLGIAAPGNSVTYNLWVQVVAL